MAELTAYSEIASLMVPDLPGAEADVIGFYLLRAGRKFCEDTESYTLEATADLVEDTDSYTILKTDLQVRRIKSVRFLDPSIDVAKDPEDGRLISTDYYELLADDVIQFHTNAVPNSSEDGYLLVVESAYVPHANVDVLPDNFLTRWADAIRYRAMYEVLSLPGRPWSSPEEAARHKGLYDDAIVRGRLEAEHKSKTVIKRMCAPSFI